MNFLIKRTKISHYYKDVYNLEKLPVVEDNNKFAIDESLFTHINEEQIWVIGIINNKTFDLRLKLSKQRNSETLKKIITNMFYLVVILLLIAGMVIIG